MKKASYIAIYDALTAANFADKDILAELYKEIHRGDDEKAQRAKTYDLIKSRVFEILGLASEPMTVSEIFEKCKPCGYTSGQIQYGLTHYWTDEIEITRGKVNTYSLKG